MDNEPAGNFGQAGCGDARQTIHAFEQCGDAFVVYPGTDGPIDSIRWEVFAESLQDYALLQTAGLKPNDPMLESLLDYQSFPKTEKWLADARAKILS